MSVQYIQLYANEPICCSANFGCCYTFPTLTVNSTSTTSISDELANMMIGIYCGCYLICLAIVEEMINLS